MSFMDVGNASSGRGLSIGSINSTISPALYAQEARFNNALEAIKAKGSDNMSQLDLLQMQQQLQQLNMFVELQSTIMKALTDSLKSIIQKSS